MDDDIIEIRRRNARVEADKAWETSSIRRAVIAILTYLVAAIYMTFVGLPSPFIGAFIPTGGYVLSTLSLPFLKKYWLNNLYKKDASL